MSSPQKDGKPPCKVVVLGLEGQPPAVLEEANRRFAGEISRFYNASRQNSDNSRGDVWYQHKLLPGGAGRLHYSSNQGLETLTIRLNPKAVETLEEKVPPQPKRPWDWLLIELDIPVFVHNYVSDVDPGVQTSQATIAARLAAPSEENSATDDQSFTAIMATPEERPLLQFAGAPGADQIGDLETAPIQRSSLLVDIRRFPTNNVIEIELFGSLEELPDDGEPSASGVTGKTLKAVIRHGMDMAGRFPSGAVGAEYNTLYVRGSTDFIEDNYPALWATITGVNSVSSGAGLNSLLPPGFSVADDAATLTAALVDPAKFTPATFDEPINTREFNRLYGSHSWRVTPAGSDWALGVWGAGGDPAVRFASFPTGSSMSTEPLLDDTAEAHGPGVITQQGMLHYIVQQSVGAAARGAYGFAATPPVEPETRPAPGAGTESRNMLHSIRWFTYIFEPTYGTADTPVEVEPESNATLNAVAFQGTPPWAWSEHQTEDGVTAEAFGEEPWTYGRWELEDRYPERVKAREVATGITITTEGDSANPSGLKYLGRVVFEQAHGTFSFEAP